MTTILGRDAILQNNSFKQREVTVAELGGVLLVRELSGLHAAEFQRRSMALVDTQKTQIRDAKELAELSAQVWVWGVIDKDGQALFTREDIPRITGMPARIVDLVADAILDLSGLSQRALRRAKKNSMTPANDSGTD
ncbi:MAG: hypothetical protein AB7L09_24575 [Nitrospira sp.]